MQTLTLNEITKVSGGELDRETQQSIVGTLVGGISGGNIFAVALSQWAMGQYYDFQHHINISASGPATNHLTTRQFRTMRRE